MDIVTIENVSKSFGNNIVIDNLSFSVPEHSIFGFIGQNGSGKTTTMKMILGLLKPDSGTIQVCGEKVQFGQTKTNQNIGYLPDVPEFYSFLKPKEYLKLCGEITGMPKDRILSRSNELLKLVGLGDVNKKIGGFSRGMKQRLGIAQALLNEPKLLICDEPTSALDPIGRKDILDILTAIKGKTTVIFSTHILSDVERICDNIALIDKGKLVIHGTIGEIKANHKSDKLFIEFVSKNDKDKFLAILRSVPYEQTETSIMIATNNISQVHSKVLHILASENILPIKLEIVEPSIESLFMEVVV